MLCCDAQVRSATFGPLAGPGAGGGGVARRDVPSFFAVLPCASAMKYIAATVVAADLFESEASEA